MPIEISMTCVRCGGRGQRFGHKSINGQQCGDCQGTGKVTEQHHAMQIARAFPQNSPFALAAIAKEAKDGVVNRGQLQPRNLTTKGRIELTPPPPQPPASPARNPWALPVPDLPLPGEPAPVPTKTHYVINGKAVAIKDVPQSMRATFEELERTQKVAKPAAQPPRKRKLRLE